MLRLDEFESVFKSATKRRFEPQTVGISSALIFTDLGEEAARLFTHDVEQMLSGLGDVKFQSFHGTQFDDVGELLDIVEKERPDLICAYRNLHGKARTFPFSLGAHVDVMTQATDTPVLLVPPPTDEGRLAEQCRPPQTVMVLTDHLTGSDHLVSFGLYFTPPKGKLVLTHLEDDATFKRYIEVISKVPTIDTEIALQDIGEQLLKEPHDYIVSCGEELAEKGSKPVELVEVVEMGHHIEDCKRLIAEHSVDLLVMNTKDEEQLAMHGLAYPLTIELRDVPLLLL